MWMGRSAGARRIGRARRAARRGKRTARLIGGWQKESVGVAVWRGECGGLVVVVGVVVVGVGMEGGGWRVEGKREGSETGAIIKAACGGWGVRAPEGQRA